MKQWFHGAFLALIVVVAGCSGQNAGETGKLSVAATTGMIADAARNIGGEHIHVTTLMGPGVDPHLYKASAGDVATLTRADLILYNGLHLEGKITDLFAKMARQKTTVAVAEAVPDDRLISDGEGSHDPHIWFDVSLWQSAVHEIMRALNQAAPEHKAEFAKNGKTYLKQLSKLHTYVSEKATAVPAEKRLLVTAHDAFGYFGRAYGFKVRGLQGISTTSEAGTSDIDRLANLLVNRKVGAIFVETSVSKRYIRALKDAVLAKGGAVQIGDPLFSDSLGGNDTPEGTYIGTVRHNIDTIVAYLRK